LFGVVSDRKIAAALNVHISTVAAERHRRGILPYEKKRTPKLVKCEVCGETFEWFGRVGYMRRAHPPPWPCEGLLRDARRALNAPSLSKLTRRIPGYHLLDPLDD
jgi:hypothetical protein